MQSTHEMHPFFVVIVMTFNWKGGEDDSEDEEQDAEETEWESVVVVPCQNSGCLSFAKNCIKISLIVYAWNHAAIRIQEDVWRLVSPFKGHNFGGGGGGLRRVVLRRRMAVVVCWVESLKKTKRNNKYLPYKAAKVEECTHRTHRSRAREQEREKRGCKTQGLLILWLAGWVAGWVATPA